MENETLPRFAGGSETNSTAQRGRNREFRWSPRRGRGNFNNRGAKNNYRRRGENYEQGEYSDFPEGQYVSRKHERGADEAEFRSDRSETRYHPSTSRMDNEAAEMNKNYSTRGKKERNGKMSAFAKEFVPYSARPAVASNFPCCVSAVNTNKYQSTSNFNHSGDLNDSASKGNSSHKNRHSEKKSKQPCENHSRGNYLTGSWFQKKSNHVENNSRNNFTRNNHVFTRKNKESFETVKEDEISHRDRLIEQLVHNNCECSVCCDHVRGQDAVWSCSNCYNIFHLKCARKWARSPAAIVEGAGWRCPVCQHVKEKIPNQYFCFCGKMRDPPWNHYITPHSCGEPCGRRRVQNNCVHRCNILCHPGPCPPCQLQVKRECECGKSLQTVRCGQMDPVLCHKTCGKLLNCGVHQCNKICHLGACSPCTQKIDQQCYCGKETKQVLCAQETAREKYFSCEKVCGRKLDCANHFCTSICHPGLCSFCQLTPELVTHCPCGKTALTDINGGVYRNSCTDPILSCREICDKILTCGPPDNYHRCTSHCHTGPCPACPLTTQIKCRCGSHSKQIPCAELATMTEFLCEKKCNKKRQCGRHKCLQKCCIDTVHLCPLVCNRKLSCGLHSCEDQCHRGNCAPCWHTSFDELACHCGATVLYPPIACGTKPPECSQPCSRLHPCGHPVTHSCHNDAACPPCTFLTEKWCYGDHELRSNVPCYLEDISCGRPCCKILLCKKHKCPLICHSGACLKPGISCNLPCTKQRPLCAHPCGVPCHGDRPCPDTSCRAKVTVTCQCGHLTETITCAENQRALRLMAASSMAVKMNSVSQGQTVDISELVKTSNKTKRLECNEDCALIDRNRRLALALQIRNPELTNKLGPPSYTDFLKEQMKNNSRFVTQIYTKLTDVVQSAKQSKQKSRSFAFPPMNRDQRRVIHELAEYFGCETQSYDEEPKKNVVITALRDKSWLPSVSLMTVIERESIHRKAPPPIPHNRAQLSNSKTDVTETPTASSESKNVVDYFDYVPPP